MLVAFMPRLRTSLHRMLQQYDSLSQERDLDFVFVVASPELWEVDSIPGRPGIRVVKVGPIHRQDEIDLFPEWLRKRCSPAANRKLRHALPFSLLAAYRASQHLNAAREQLVAALGALDPDVLMMPGDRELGFVLPALTAARDLGIPTIVSEMGVPNPSGQFSTRRGESRFKLSPWWRAPVLNHLAAALYPRQVYPGAGERILFSPGWLTLALARQGMISDTPWVQGGGPSTAIVCASPSRADVLARYGVPPWKIIVTGDCAHDSIFRGLQSRSDIRARLVRMHGLASDRLLVIVAVPNYAEHNLISWPDHLSAIEKLFAALARSGCNVVLSLHPKSDRSRYAPAAERHGLPIDGDPLVSILPAADVFVAGGSSTIEWAVLCGAPVINVNYANLSVDSLASFGGLQNVTNPSDVLAVLDRLVRDPEWLRRQRDAQSASAPVLSLFDGQCGARLAAATRRLAAAKCVTLSPDEAEAPASGLVPFGDRGRHGMAS